MPIQFATQSYRHDSLPLSAQRCVNMYAEAQPKSAKSEIAVLGVPGIVDFATCGAGPLRGMHNFADTLYAVSGNYLYSVSETGAAVQLGGQISGTGVVSIDDNGDQLCIVNGSNGYIYDTTGGFRLISDVDFHPAKTVTNIDSFFLFDRDGTNEFFRSDSLDGDSYSDSFASAETKSDTVTAVINHEQLLHVIGSRTIELWANLGAAGFPFQRAATVPRGCISPHGIVSEDKRLFFPGEDHIAYQLGGTALAPISTHAISQAWQKYATYDDAIASRYTWEGHKFINWTFPRQNVTWGYDLTTGLWHERVSWDRTGNSLGRWTGNCVTECYNRVFVGDAFSGKIGYLDRTTFTEFGNTIQAELVSPPLHGDGKRVFFPWFELDVDTGVGLVSGQGSDPQIMLGISDDGGRTWSDQELWRSMGATGEYRKQLRWDRLGSSFNRHFKLTISDPVRRTIIAARCPGMRIGT